MMLYLRVCVLWNKRALTYGPHKIKSILRNKIRQAFTFMGLMMSIGNFETLGKVEIVKKPIKRADGRRLNIEKTSFIYQ